MKIENYKQFRTMIILKIKKKYFFIFEFLQVPERHSANKVNVRYDMNFDRKVSKNMCLFINPYT